MSSQEEITEESKLKALDLALNQLDRQYKDKTVVKLSTDDVTKWPAYSTGVFALDKALGIGGFPIGRIVEIYGTESAGKSTIALSVITRAQAQGMNCLYIDAEHALDPVYMEALGIDRDKFYLAQPSYGEQGLEIAEKLIKTGAIGLCVIDSVSALIPKAELEADFEQAHMALQARMMSKAMRSLTSIASENKCCIIFINQIRHKVGVMYGSPETTSGGNALKYAASVRLDLRKKEDIKDSTGNIIGTRVKAKIIKNKLAPPLKLCEFDILYGKGPDSNSSLLEAAVDYGLLVKGGAGWYSLASDPDIKIQGFANIKENKEIMELIKQQMKELEQDK